MSNEKPIAAAPSIDRGRNEYEPDHCRKCHRSVATNAGRCDYCDPVPTKPIADIAAPEKCESCGKLEIICCGERTVRFIAIRESGAGRLHGLEARGVVRVVDSLRARAETFRDAWNKASGERNVSRDAEHAQRARAEKAEADFALRNREATENFNECMRLIGENTKVLARAEKAESELRKVSTESSMEIAILSRQEAEQEEAARFAKNEVDALRAELAASKATLAMVAARLGGIVEGQPTGTHNLLQRVDALVATEAERDALRDTKAKGNCRRCGQVWDAGVIAAVSESTAMRAGLGSVMDERDAALIERDALKAQLAAMDAESARDAAEARCAELAKERDEARALKISEVSMEMHRVISERDALKAQLAALDAEAKALPSVEEVVHRIDACEGWKESATILEHRDLISARRAQVRAGGMRKALEMARKVITRDARCGRGFDGVTPTTCDAVACRSVSCIDAALADEPADVLGEVVEALRAAKNFGSAETRINRVLAMLGAKP